MNVAILGAGAWGSAMAIHLNRCGQRVTLVPRRVEHAAEIAGTRENAAYLPGVPFPRDIQIAYVPAPALAECDALIFACPSKALRETALRVKACVPSATKIVISLCKGLEAGTLLRPDQVLRDVFPALPHGAISGPTNAAEVARGFPVAVVFASDAPAHVSEEIQGAFSNGAFRIYRSSDLIGVELGGALKNIYAIAAGICDGMELGANARASLLTRALAEMGRIVEAEGGNVETVRGLSGMGDLVATATADWSRNRAFGIEIARSGTQAALEKMRAGRAVVEGYYAAKNFYETTRRDGVSAPILECAYDVIFRGVPAESVIAALMTRALKEE